MILIGFVITFVLMIGIVLVFSYSKFHDVLIDLKSEFNNQNEQNKKNIDNIKQQIKEYDNIFKKLNKDSKLDEFLNKYSDSDHNNSIRQSRTLRSIDISNRLNSYLIEWLFNKTSNDTLNLRKKSLRNLLLNKTTQNSEEYNNYLLYNTLIQQFMNVNKS